MSKAEARSVQCNNPQCSIVSKASHSPIVKIIKTHLEISARFSRVYDGLSTRMCVPLAATATIHTNFNEKDMRAYAVWLRDMYDEKEARRSASGCCRLSFVHLILSIGKVRQDTSCI